MSVSEDILEYSKLPVSFLFFLFSFYLLRKVMLYKLSQNDDEMFEIERRK